ncbi:MAG: DUF1801 domain-containing protein [Oscillospiraceae bacterium]|nr:DUF1801 domain-containing protein [Oscillospiraceae bacterium]
MWRCPICGREFKNTNQSHYCGNADTIDGYIESQPADVRPILLKIRETIAEAAPGAIEKMSWQMPTFWQNENLIHFAAFKKHIGIYPGGEATAVFADRLSESGYKTAKGTIRLPLDKPIPYGLIAEITKWRAAEAQNSGDEQRSIP